MIFPPFRVIYNHEDNTMTEKHIKQIKAQLSLGESIDRIYKAYEESQNERVQKYIVSTVNSIAKIFGEKASKNN